MRPTVLGVVPARLGSTRLPDKPLHPVLGRPLLEWVWRRVQDMGVFDELVVATDHERIARVCRELGAPVLLTDPAHPSGTDRVAEVALSERYREHGIVVNVQADEPLVEEAHLESAVALVRHGGWEVGTGAVPIREPGRIHDPSVVKVVRAGDGRALYFSRAPVPFKRDGPPSTADLAAGIYLAHLGVYAYRREALLRWVSLPPSRLEETERLEQLRALEAGIPIGVAVVEHAHPGVDTAEDVARMEGILRESRSPQPTTKES